jgi:hypothetical protein
VAGYDTAASLLNLAIWSLREQGLVELEQLRPVQKETALVMGGQPFAAMTVGDGPAGGNGAGATTGLERAVLEAARASDPGAGVRGALQAMDLPYQGPWTKIVGLCAAEAQAAGLIAMKGLFVKKPVVTDAAAVEALRTRNEEIAAGRAAYREENADLDAAVYGDCFAAIRWAHGNA